MVNHQFEVVDVQGRLGLVTLRGGDLNHLEAKFPDFLREAAQADLNGPPRATWLRVGKGSTDGLAWLREFLQKGVDGGQITSFSEVTGGRVLVHTNPRKPWERDPAQYR